MFRFYDKNSLTDERLMEGTVEGWGINGGQSFIEMLTGNTVAGQLGGNAVLPEFTAQLPAPTVELPIQHGYSEYPAPTSEDAESMMLSLFAPPTDPTTHITGILNLNTYPYSDQSEQLILFNEMDELNDPHLLTSEKNVSHLAKAKKKGNLGDIVPEELENKFVFDADGTSAHLDIQNYSTSQIRALRVLFRDKAKRSNTPYKQFLAFTKTLTPERKKIFSISVIPGKALPAGLSLNDCVHKLLTPIKPRIEWDKMECEWLEEEKKSVSITPGIRITKKLVKYLNTKIATHQNYKNNIIRVTKRNTTTLQAKFVYDEDKFNGKNLKECMIEILTEKPQPRQDSSKGCFYFVNDDDRTIARLKPRDNQSNREMCQQLGVSCLRRSKKTPYFSALIFSNANNQSIASIRKGHTLPEGITLAQCLTELGLQLWLLALTEEEKAPIFPQRKAPARPKTKKTIEHDFLNLGVKYELNEEKTVAHLTTGTFTNTHELRSAILSRKNSLIKAKGPTSLKDLCISYAVEDEPLKIYFKHNRNDHARLLICLNLLGLHQHNPDHELDSISQPGQKRSREIEGEKEIVEVPAKRQRTIPDFFNLGVRYEFAEQNTVAVLTLGTFANATELRRALISHKTSLLKTKNTIDLNNLRISYASKGLVKLYLKRKNNDPEKFATYLNLLGLYENNPDQTPDSLSQPGQKSRCEEDKTPPMTEGECLSPPTATHEMHDLLNKFSDGTIIAVTSAASANETALLLHSSHLKRFGFFPVPTQPVRSLSPDSLSEVTQDNVPKPH